MNTGSPFDYSFWAPQAAEIRRLEATSSLNMIKAGDLLRFVKRELLMHGRFTGWIKSQLPISPRTVQRYIAISKMAEGKTDMVSLLSPAVLRMLAEKFTPPATVAEVIAQADAGNILSESAVEAMLSDARDTKRQEKCEAEKAARREKAKRVRAKKAAEKEIWRAEKEHKRLAVHAKARSIMDRLSLEDASFLADALSYDVADEFVRLVRERVTELGGVSISRASEVCA